MQKIKLTKGYEAMISDGDFERVSALKWCASIESRGTKVYAVRFEYKDKKKIKVRMHHFVLGIRGKDLPEGYVVDHVNGDSLDNRRENLEIITQTENMERSKGWKKKRVECVL